MNKTINAPVNAKTSARSLWSSAVFPIMLGLTFGHMSIHAVEEQAQTYKKQTPIEAYEQKMMAAAYISEFAKNFSKEYQKFMESMHAGFNYLDNSENTDTMYARSKIRLYASKFQELEAQKPTLTNLIEIAESRKIGETNTQKIKEYAEQAEHFVGKIFSERQEITPQELKSMGPEDALALLINAVNFFIDKIFSYEIAPILTIGNFLKSTDCDVIKIVEEKTDFKFPKIGIDAEGKAELQGGGMQSDIGYAESLSSLYNPNTKVINYNIDPFTNLLIKSKKDIENSLILIYGHFRLILESLMFPDSDNEPKGCAGSRNKTYE